MSTVKDPVGLVNAVRSSMSPSMQEAIPEATALNVAEVGSPVLQWQDVANAFYTTLINLIGKQYVEYRDYKNPLNMFKRGESRLGSDIQEIAINFMKEKKYDVSGADLLTNSAPDLKACYYKLNRQVKFDVTTIEPELQLAFTSWDNFGTLVSRIVDNLYRSNEAGEFEWAKAVFDQAITDAKLPVATVTAITDTASANAFAKTVKAYSRKFTFPSQDYNAYNLMNSSDSNKLTTFTPKDEQVLIITPEVESAIDVDSLAVAFNMDKVQFMGRVVVIDKFTDPKVQAMLVDSSFVRIWDNTKYFNSFVNPANMSIKHYLHVWQTYAYTPFANAVVFKTA